jgi:hypothetical protein
MDDAIFLVVLGAFSILYAAGWFAIRLPKGKRSAALNRARLRSNARSSRWVWHLSVVHSRVAVAIAVEVPPEQVRQIIILIRALLKEGPAGTPKCRSGSPPRPYYPWGY